ncbi:MAG: AEC family transporter [Firmicutes bacterium]|nr:AEC family transporter [Bacillota bacterium]
MDTLLFALNAVLPILLLIALGYYLKRIRFLNENFLVIGNKFVFRVALPALLYYTIYSISSMNEINWPVVLYSVMAIMILFLIGLIISLVFIKNPRQKGVIIQAVFRSNFAIIGIPLAEAIGGSQAVAVVALVSAIVVPLMNVLSVIALAMFVKEEDAKSPFKSMLSTLTKIVKNPLIIGVALGLLTLFIRSFIPIDSTTELPVFSIKDNLEFLYLLIKWLGQVASPLALIILGGTFDFFVIKPLAKQIVIGTVSRVVIAPLVTLSLAVLLSKYTTFFNFTSMHYPAFIALLASPTAVSSAIMAKEMDNDELLAVQLVVWTTTFSILSIFIIVVIFRATGLL